MTLLGYEIGTGKAVSIPLRHTAVTGQTQESGKTTTLEAIITRSGLRAVAFLTKRGEGGFRLQTPMAPYFREPRIAPETPMWRWVESIFESIGETVGKDEKAAIIQAADEELEWESYNQKGEKKRRLAPSGRRVETLEQVAKNVERMKQGARGKMQTALTLLNAYFEIVLPQIRKLKASRELSLQPGVNVMNLIGLSVEMQMLIIRSVLEEVYLHGKQTVVIIPECAKILPRMRSTPVRLTAEIFIREGLVLGNVLMLDSQDLANVATEVLKNVGVWILGKQGEINEVKRVVDYIPAIPKIPREAIMQLGKGEFYAVFSGQVRKTYVQPAGMPDTHAQAIARGDVSPDTWKQIVRRLDQEQDERTPRQVQIQTQEGDPDASAEAAAVIEGYREQASADAKGEIDELLTTEEDEMQSNDVELSDLRRLLRAEQEKNAELQRELESLRRQISASIDAGETVLADRKPAQTPETAKRPPVNLEVKAIALDGNMAEFLRALRSHPEVIHFIRQQPEIRVEIERPVVDWSGTSPKGRMARLITEKFFEQPRQGGEILREFKRRGWMREKGGFIELQGPVRELTEMGFLTSEPQGYQSVPGMKVTTVDA